MSQHDDFRPQLMKIKTTDDFVMELSDTIVEKSFLFKNISSIPSTEDALEILIDSTTLDEIIGFAEKDKRMLKKNYNPLEIHFSIDMLDYFEKKSTRDILKICNAANYLEYPYLLELCCKLLATKISQGSLKIKTEILGDAKIDDKDIERILSDLYWMEDAI